VIAFLITERAYFSAKWLDKWKNSLRFLPSTPKKHHVSSECDSPSKWVALGELSNAFPLHEQGPRYREVSASAVLPLDDPNKDEGSQDMDLDPDTDDANNKHGQVQNREESPNNPEAALVSQSKKQFKKSSKHATITENEIEPVMEEFIYA